MRNTINTPVSHGYTNVDGTAYTIAKSNRYTFGSAGAGVKYFDAIAS
jgi:hypothetical protein